MTTRRNAFNRKHKTDDGHMKTRLANQNDKKDSDKFLTEKVKNREKIDVVDQNSRVWVEKGGESPAPSL